MSIKLITISILLISFQIPDPVQSAIIRGVNIPNLNLTKITGKWYQLTSPRGNGLLACTSDVIDQLSENSFTVNTTYTFAPDAKTLNPNIPEKPLTSFIHSVVQKDTNIIMSTDNVGNQQAIVIFDVDYRSHLAIYTAYTPEKISTGTDGMVYIVGRQKTLSDDIYEKIKQSIFYQQGMEPGLEIVTLDTSGCE